MIGLPKKYFDRVQNFWTPYSGPDSAASNPSWTFTFKVLMFHFFQMIGASDCEFPKRHASPTHHIILPVATKENFENNVCLFLVENTGDKGHIPPFCVKIDQFLYFCIGCQNPLVLGISSHLSIHILTILPSPILQINPSCKRSLAELILRQAKDDWLHIATSSIDSLWQYLAFRIRAARLLGFCNKTIRIL